MLAKVSVKVSPETEPPVENWSSAASWRVYEETPSQAVQVASAVVAVTLVTVSVGTVTGATSPSVVALPGAETGLVSPYTDDVARSW